MNAEVTASITRWRLDPVNMVRELFQAAPDTWQAKALGAFSTEPRLAIKSAKGPGGTAPLAWRGWNSAHARALQH